MKLITYLDYSEFYHVTGTAWFRPPSRYRERKKEKINLIENYTNVKRGPFGISTGKFSKVIDFNHFRSNSFRSNSFSKWPICEQFPKVSISVFLQQFSKWPISEMTHFRSDPFWKCPVLKWFNFEEAHFGSDRFRSDLFLKRPISKWPIFEVFHFWGDTFRSALFSKWLNFEVRHFRSNLFPKWHFKTTPFFKWKFLIIDNHISIPAQTIAVNRGFLYPENQKKEETSSWCFIKLCTRNPLIISMINDKYWQGVRHF